jgi:hypothetical protein
MGFRCKFSSAAKELRWKMHRALEVASEPQLRFMFGVRLSGLPGLAAIVSSPARYGRKKYPATTSRGFQSSGGND